MKKKTGNKDEEKPRSLHAVEGIDNSDDKQSFLRRSEGSHLLSVGIGLQAAQCFRENLV